MLNKGASRLVGLEPPTREDKEASLEVLVTSVADTIVYVKGIDPKQMEVAVPVGHQQMTIKGVDYLFHFSMPNLYFHVTTAYDILRHNGLQIGKLDFIGNQ